MPKSTLFYRARKALLVVAALCSIASCKKDDFENEVTLKKLNFAKRVNFTDREWSELHQGKAAYEKYCSGCHGLKGDGNGPAAEMLEVKPRNFTRGMFKFISTQPGTLPSDNDLHRTILRGVPRSSMPNWSLLTEPERNAIILYIKSFSERWQTDPAPQEITFPEPPKWIGSAQSVASGRAVYAKMGCANCHGERGNADGQSAATLKDAENNPILPFNFHDGVLKGGSTVKDIYRTFYTGLNGTPMPAYGGILSEDENWHLVSYVVYLMGKTHVSESDLASLESHNAIDTNAALIPASHKKLATK